MIFYNTSHHQFQLQRAQAQPSRGVELRRVDQVLPPAFRNDASKFGVGVVHRRDVADDDFSVDVVVVVVVVVTVTADDLLCLAGIACQRPSSSFAAPWEPRTGSNRFFLINSIDTLTLPFLLLGIQSNISLTVTWNLFVLFDTKFNSLIPVIDAFITNYNL